PSLYLVYPNEQVGVKKNREYLESNLKYSLQLGEQFNKPVIPWVWHIIHPTNKDFGGNLISKEDFSNYIALIASTKYKNKGAEGVLIWEPSDASFNTYMERSRKQQKS